MWYWIADMALPALGFTFGAALKKRPPEYGRSRRGYGSKRAQESKEAWEYAQRRLGEMWLKVGLCLIVFVALHTAFSTMAPEYVTAINVSASFACLAAVIPVLEKELVAVFGKDDEKQGPTTR